MALNEADSTAEPVGKGAAWLRACLDAQEGRLMLWAPILLIVGIWTYFNLAHEPGGTAVLALALLVIPLVYVGGRATISMVAALVVLGFAAAKFREFVVETPLLRSTVSESDISGFVADADNRGGKRRILVVELDSATHIPASERPRRVRITTFHAPDVLIGDYVSMKARLSPLPLPVSPGAFDYGRDLFFQSIGAVGTSKNEPRIEPQAVPTKFVVRRFFHAMRSAMGERIVAVIGGPLGAFANAVITGERAAIPKDMNLSLQVSGLAHILSISGLHMTLVAGGVFWVVRAVLALFPAIALHFAIKKWAAVAAMIVGLIYMLLADSGSATERSYIMIAVMFLAILVDRPALSLRNLAISALIILLATPEESMGASFQMSFLAVMGLAAFFEWWNARPAYVPLQSSSRMWRTVLYISRVLVGSILTSLVAGGFSSLAAAYHFGRMAPYGVIANALSLPIVSLAVMPAALASAVLMPLGLEYYPLKLMEFGLWLTMQISDFVASFPHANMQLAKPNVVAIITAVFGAAFMCIVGGKLRLLGAAVLAVGLSTLQWQQRPHILIEERGSNVAVLNAAQNYVFADATKGKFAGDKWLLANGETLKIAEAAAKPAWQCVDGMCFADVENQTIGYIHEQQGADWPCPPVDVLIADFPLHKACAEIPIRIDRFDVWKQGAHALYKSGNAWRIETVKDLQGQRPWTYVPRARDKPFVPQLQLPATSFSG
jgi:competence protein ComEC